jgi:HAD superfamily hydrolase (TIGR01450 family)
LTTRPLVGLSGSATALARTYDLAVLDLDGVLYIGPDAVPGAPEALRAAREAGLAVCFVTNNASRPVSTVAAHLTRLGIPAEVAEVVTSAQVAASMLARRLPAGAAVLVVGGEGLHVALTEQGLNPVRSVQEAPQAVVQGFHPDLSWRDLAEGTHAVRSGLFWLATNLDLTVPTPHGPAPGNGALVGLVAAAAGREPDEVAGKPMPGSFVEAARRYGSVRPLVVGDRLDTDLEGARAAGQDGLLVLTGVSGATDLVACPAHRRPRYVGRDLTALLQPHPEVTVERVTPEPGGGVRSCCRAAAVVAEHGVLRVVRAGEDPVDLLRACAQAAWAWSDGAWSDGAAGRPDPPAADPGPVLEVMRRLGNDVTWAR